MDDNKTAMIEAIDLSSLANGLDLEGLQVISASNSLAMPEGGASCCSGSGYSCCCTCCCP